MRRLLAAVMVLIMLTAPLLAQDLPVDVITHPIAIPVPPVAPDLAAVWQALQRLAEGQATLRAQVTPLVGLDVTANSRLTALDTRVLTLESKPPGPSAVSSFFGAIVSVLTNQYVVGAAVAIVGCKTTGKC